jgi:hypothetical protein
VQYPGRLDGGVREIPPNGGRGGTSYGLMMKRLAILIPGVLALAAVSPTHAEACGPYGGRGSGEYDVVVHVLATTAPSGGVAVHAKCGDEFVFGSQREDGAFVLLGLSGRACTIEAAGYELEGDQRRATRRVRLPRERVVLSLPEHANRLA